MVNHPNIAHSGDVFKTSSLDLAAFLRLQGHNLIRTAAPSEGSLLEFHFPASDAIHADVETYFNGTATLHPLQLFETYHSLRTMMLTLRQSLRRTGGSNVSSR